MHAALPCLLAQQSAGELGATKSEPDRNQGDMRPAPWSYQLLDAGLAHPRGAGSLQRGQRNFFGERPLRAFLATMEYRMLAMPKGTPPSVAGPSQLRLAPDISGVRLFAAPDGSQAAGRPAGPERGEEAAHCACTHPLLREPSNPAVFLRLEA